VWCIRVAGNRGHTFERNALWGLSYARGAAAAAWIEFRLDKDNQRPVVVARTPEAQTSRSRQLEAEMGARICWPMRGAS